MLKSRLLMQPPIMLRLVMSGVLACSFSANGLRADDVFLAGVEASEDWFGADHLQ